MPRTCDATEKYMRLQIHTNYMYFTFAAVCILYFPRLQMQSRANRLRSVNVKNTILNVQRVRWPRVSQYIVIFLIWSCLSAQVVVSSGFARPELVGTMYVFATPCYTLQCCLPTCTRNNESYRYLPVIYQLNKKINLYIGARFSSSSPKPDPVEL